MTPLTPAVVAQLAADAAAKLGLLDPLLVQQVCREWEEQREEMATCQPLWSTTLAEGMEAITELQQQLDAARAAVQAVEWLDTNTDPCGVLLICPWCNSLFGHGHAPDCQRQAALGMGEGR